LLKVLFALPLVVSLYTPAAFAQTTAEMGWMRGACSQAIKSYIGDRSALAQRLRLADGELTGSVVVLEIGTPNDGIPAIDPEWNMRVHTNGALDKAKTIVGAQKDGWVVFRDVSSSSVPIIEQILFYPRDGDCQSLGPTDGERGGQIPKSVQAVLQTRAQARSSVSQSAAPLADTKGAEDGTFIKTQDDFDPGMDRQEQVKALYRTLPPPVMNSLGVLHQMCLADGAVNSTIDKRYVAIVDIDGDGDNDFILNDAHFFCIYRDASLKSVGGENSANIVIFSTTTKGVIQSAAVYTTAGEIRQYKGYAVYAGYGTGKTPTSKRLVQIKSGTSKEITTVPNGGKVIYTIGAGRKPSTFFAKLFGGATENNQTLQQEDTPDDPKLLEALRDGSTSAEQTADTFAVPIPSAKPGLTTTPQTASTISPGLMPQDEGRSDDQTSDILPPAVRIKLSEQYLACKRMGGENLSVDDTKFVTRADYDGDSATDYIVDQTALTCEFASGEKRVMGGNPADGKTLWFYTAKNGDVELSTELYIFKGIVRRHANFASIESTDFAGRTEVTQIRGGHASPISKVPLGGTVVLRIGE
jgi:hypothetical protein